MNHKTCTSPHLDIIVQSLHDLRPLVSCTKMWHTDDERITFWRNTCKTLPTGIYPNTYLFRKIIIKLSHYHGLVKGSSQHKVGGEWFEIKLGKISRMLVKYKVLPIPNVIFVC